ncbi:ribonuclease HI [bacterium]|nr:ribonuclease HI [bacterium]
MAKKKKWYVVFTGHQPGVYDVWFGDAGAEVQIKSYPGAKFKGYPSRSEAEGAFANFLNNGVNPIKNSRKNTLPKQVLLDFPLDKNTFILYTDGGSIGNPGPGGYGAVLKSTADTEEFSGGYRLTTNNRMEIIGCIVGLSHTPAGAKVTVYSDSRYVVNTCTKGWARRWQANNWMRTRTESAINADLWEQMLELLDQRQVKFEWVKGHAGNPLNERCDKLANSTARKSNLPPDPGYRK